jgi:hypothetical protein
VTANAECHYAVSPYDECHYAVSPYDECHYAVSPYDECHYAESRYDECHYAESRYASVLMLSVVAPSKRASLLRYKKCFNRVDREHHLLSL